MTWNKQRSLGRVRESIAALRTIEVKGLVRDMDITQLPLTTAYRVSGVHIYVAMLNARSLLGGVRETERSHKRLLRFLHIYQRVADLELFSSTDAVKVDFQNERLHFVVYKPYDDAKRRTAHAVAVAGLFKQMLEQGSALHEELVDVSVSIGIESGVTLAVNNGTKGDREPLFVGHAANHAAHLLGKPGIFVGPAARADLGWPPDSRTMITSAQEIECAKLARLDISVEKLNEAWKRELDQNVIADFEFSRPTPPLKNLDLDTLSPANSRRLDACYLVADIDGFTAFVDESVRSGSEVQAIQALHVIRKELRDVLTDFGGRKLRYVGDAIDGIVAEGTSQTTDGEETVTTAVLTAGAMRSSFALILDELPAARSLGLAVGVELGPISITRLGIKGRRDRCAVGDAAHVANEQQRAVGATNQVQVGPNALRHASRGVHKVLGESARSDANFVKLAAQLADAGDDVHAHVPPAAPVVIPPRAHAR